MTTTLTRPAPRPAIRFPLEPVMTLTRCESFEQLGLRLGVTGDAVRQWSVRGLSSQQADFVATELGYHPISIWSNFNDDLDVEFDDTDDDAVHLDALWEHFDNEDESTAALRALVSELLHAAPPTIPKPTGGKTNTRFRTRLFPRSWN